MIEDRALDIIAIVVLLVLAFAAATSLRRSREDSADRWRDLAALRLNEPMLAQ